MEELQVTEQTLTRDEAVDAALNAVAVVNEAWKAVLLTQQVPAEIVNELELMVKRTIELYLDAPQPELPFED
jgi:hypothetical protein